MPPVGLTEALISGQSPKEYAHDFGVSMNTVRTQIKSSAAKVGATRQSDLVRLVLTARLCCGSLVDGQMVRQETTAR